LVVVLALAAERRNGIARERTVVADLLRVLDATAASILWSGTAASADWLNWFTCQMPLGTGTGTGTVQQLGWQWITLLDQLQQTPSPYP
jgi:hypothetical protein